MVVHSGHFDTSGMCFSSNWCSYFLSLHRRGNNWWVKSIFEVISVGHCFFNGRFWGDAWKKWFMVTWAEVWHLLNVIGSISSIIFNPLHVLYLLHLGSVCQFHRRSFFAILRRVLIINNSPLRQWSGLLPSRTTNGLFQCHIWYFDRCFM